MAKCEAKCEAKCKIGCEAKCKLILRPNVEKSQDEAGCMADIRPDVSVYMKPNVSLNVRLRTSTS